jgi:hypothetical protein
MLHEQRFEFGWGNGKSLIFDHRAFQKS